MVKLLLGINEDSNSVFEGVSAWWMFVQNLYTDTNLDDCQQVTVDFSNNGADLESSGLPDYPQHLVIAQFAGSRGEQLFKVPEDLIKKGAIAEQKTHQVLLKDLKNHPALWKQAKE